MDNVAHSAHSFLMYYGLYALIWHHLPPPIFSLLVIIAGILPDTDGLYWKIKGGQHDNTFQHHLYFWSHWPIAYLPLVGIFLLSLLFAWYPEFFLILVVGIYSHLISDSASCGDGMMWGKIPWKKDQFAPFINYGSSKTDGYHGGYWTVRWRTTWTYRISRLEGLGISIWLLILMISTGFSFGYFATILYFLVSIIVNMIPTDSKFLAEPPNGRYDDYRKHPAYLAWMERAGYEFNPQMKAVRKKKTA
jgi:hypothetical protein